MVVSCGRGPGELRSTPGVSRRNEATAGVKDINPIPAAPDDHFGTCPNLRMLAASFGYRSESRHSGPAVRYGIVSATTVEVSTRVIATPNNHFTRGPDGLVL